MNFNDEVDWPTVFGAHIARPSLADPRNKRRSVYMTTMLFLEATLREIGDQYAGRSTLSREGLTWALTRRIIVERTKRIVDLDLSEEDRSSLRVGEGAFKDRWPGDKGMSDFFVCLVRYACTSPRWWSVLGHGTSKALRELPKVKSGDLTLADFLEKVCVPDLRLRVRLGNCWLFQLALTMDVKWGAVARQAHRELLEAYIDRWVPVYEEGMRMLGVKLRPDTSPRELATIIGTVADGFAARIVAVGDGVAVGSKDNFTLYATAVRDVIYASVDTGDGRAILEELNNVVTLE